MLSPIPQYSSSSVAQARSSIREDRVQGQTVSKASRSLEPLVLLTSNLLLIGGLGRSSTRLLRTSLMCRRRPRSLTGPSYQQQKQSYGSTDILSLSISCVLDMALRVPCHADKRPVDEALEQVPGERNEGTQPPGASGSDTLNEPTPMEQDQEEVKLRKSERGRISRRRFEIEGDPGNLILSPKTTTPSVLEFWEFPSIGWFKFNTDGASKRNLFLHGAATGHSGKSGAGGLLRDCSGTWIYGYTCKIAFSTSLQASLWFSFQLRLRELFPRD
uniref:RNase H type-1 domain-containing protein n=2 Tax=Brassica TaxID=3705 RepID=A0A3P6DIT6_BRACM|nr:unnamed protein product [Brassica rapa]